MASQKDAPVIRVLALLIGVEPTICVLAFLFGVRNKLMARLRPDLYAPSGLRWVSCPVPREYWVKDARDYQRCWHRLLERWFYDDSEIKHEVCRG